MCGALPGCSTNLILTQALYLPTTRPDYIAVVLTVSGADLGPIGVQEQEKVEANGISKERNVRLQIRQDAQAAVKTTIKSHRADKLLRVPPLETNRNICDSLLAPRILPKWLQAFARAASSSGTGHTAQYEVLHAPEYWPFTCACSVGHFSLLSRQ